MGRVAQTPLAAVGLLTPSPRSAATTAHRLPGILIKTARAGRARRLSSRFDALRVSHRWAPPASTLSVITAVYQPRPEYLLAAYDSLAKQRMPEGWQWEWLIEEDGDAPPTVTVLPDDPRIRLRSGRHHGVAIARNLATARSHGGLLKTLDGDDVLAPGVLERDIAILTGDPTIGWTTSRALDLLADGSTIPVGDGPPVRRLDPGFVLDHWRTYDHRLPVHPATLCIRRELAVALGGWMAVPGSEDTGLLIAASVTSAGHFHPEVGLLYRKWAGQMSAAPEHTEGTERDLRSALIDERADALKQLWAAGH